MKPIKKYIETSFFEYCNLPLSKSLSEASFHNFKNDDILTDRYIKEFISNYSDEYLSWYTQYNNLEDEDEEFLIDSPDFYSYIKNELEANLEEAKENIYDKIDPLTGGIKIYREITVGPDWLDHLKKQGKRLGIYWSWDDEAAEAHWGDPSKKNSALLEVEIDEKYVDWETTLQLNSHPYYKQEKEIRLFKNTPIVLKNLSINNEKIDLSVFDNKDFYS